MAALLLYFFMALCISFMCSLLEAILLSVRRPYIMLLIREGRRSGHLWDKLKKRVNFPLAAILSLNTIANTLGAAGVGAEVAKLYGSEGQVLAIASGTLTLSILVFSEIIPKTVGATHWKIFAPASVYVIQVLIWLMFPLVWLLEGLSRRLAGRHAVAAISRAELAVLADLGEAERSLTRRESQVIRNLMKFHEHRTDEVMTPRAVIFAFPLETTVGEVFEQHPRLRFSRILVYGEGLDDVKGFVLRHRIIEEEVADRRHTKLEQLLKPIHAVPATKKIDSLLDEFIERKEHLFLVVDEYGGTAGIVSLEDVIETLLSVEIVDELDPVDDMRKLATERWEKKRKELDL